MKIDLNADVSEGFGAYASFESEKLYDFITSANIACGFHAGDPILMKNTLLKCQAKGIQMGAHPGYRDLVGFGRRALQLSDDEAVGDLLYQVGALTLMGKSLSAHVNYVKLHGAWYNSAMQGHNALAMIEALAKAAPQLGWLALSSSPFAKVCEERSIPVFHEVFADRAYQDNGALVSRNQSGAVIHDSYRAIEHVKRMVIDGKVKTISGNLMPIQVDSICIHGDNPSAVLFAEQLRGALENEGVVFSAFNTLGASHV